jgi:hypothetical protein
MSPGKQAEHAPASQRRKPFYGWWVAVAAGIGLGLGYGPIIVYTFTIFLNPLLQQFHSSRGEVSFAFTLANVAAAISSPLAGRTRRSCERSRCAFGRADESHQQPAKWSRHTLQRVPSRAAGAKTAQSSRP